MSVASRAASTRAQARTDADLLVRQLFVQMHGFAQLARAGYLIGVYGPDDVLAGSLRDFAVAAGDEPERAAASVRSGLAG